MENKKAFVREFGELLHKFGVEEIVHMEYERKGSLETVVITFHGGGQIEVNVSMDSYVAIIRDVMKMLY